MGKACGKEQRSGFAQNTTYRQDTSGDDTIHAAGKDNSTDNTPLTGAQTKCAFTVGLRNGFQALLRSTHDGRQIHNYQRQRTCHQASSHAVGEQQHTNQTIDDGGDAGKGFCSIFDDTNHFFVGCVLGHINSRTHPQRQNDEQGCQHDIDCVQNVRQDTDALGQIAGLGGEQFQSNVGNTLSQHIDQQEQNQRSRQTNGQQHQCFHQYFKAFSVSG